MTEGSIRVSKRRHVASQPRAPPDLRTGTPSQPGTVCPPLADRVSGVSRCTCHAGSRCRIARTRQDFASEITRMWQSAPTWAAPRSFGAAVGASLDLRDGCFRLHAAISSILRLVPLAVPLRARARPAPTDSTGGASTSRWTYRPVSTPRAVLASGRTGPSCPSCGHARRRSLRPRRSRRCG